MHKCDIKCVKWYPVKVAPLQRVTEAPYNKAMDTRKRFKGKFEGEFS